MKYPVLITIVCKTEKKCLYSGPNLLNHIGRIEKVFIQSPIWLTYSRTLSLWTVIVNFRDLAFHSITNLQILYILNILWLTKKMERLMHGPVLLKRKCPSTNYVVNNLYYFLQLSLKKAKKKNCAELIWI